MRKLDRVLVNDHWRDSFRDSLSVFDPPGDSDHSPCLVYSSAVVERSNKGFKYFSFLSTHRKFKDVIIEAWQVEVGVGSKLFVLAQTMRVVKAACRKLNREGFGNIQQRTKESLEKLEEIQAAMMITPSDRLFRK